MMVVAENKRRVLAGLVTVVVLLAVGFLIGRGTGGGSANAQAASPPKSARTVTTPTLAPKLRVVQGADTALSAKLKHANSENKKLVAAAKRSTARLHEAQQCARVHRVKVMRRCVERAAGA